MTGHKLEGVRKMEINLLSLNFIYTIVLLVHGIGHLLGVISIVGRFIKSPKFTSNSWLLSDRLRLSEEIVRALGMFWIVATVGFIAAAWGFWSGLFWWRSLAWIMVVLSIVLFVLWWNAFTVNLPIQANIGNIIVIAGLLFL